MKTQVAELLAELEEEYQKTDLVSSPVVCPEYAWAAIRHLERNCDIPCDHEGGPEYCDLSGFGRYSGTFIAKLINAFPQLRDALKELEG